ncbi:glycosyltransferase [Methanobrevibacter acididurans]|uniref:glycosyltransferase n=1 Tax=Methanobrevibacter acididurans TaxID=120963 RepID=UPI0038FC6E0A
MGLNNLNKQNLSKKIKYHFPIVYLLFKPNKQMFKNIKGFRSIKKNNLFDEEFYLSNYKDVKASGMNPIIHYIIYGYKEGKDPNKDFDGVYYSHKYGDALSSKLSPLVHYSLYGLQENREYKLDKNLFPIIPYEKVVNILKKLNNNLPKNKLIENIQKHLLNSNYPINKDCKSNKKRVLYLVHEKIGSFAGTGFTTNDIIDNIQDSYECYILTSNGLELELWRKEIDHFEKLGQWDVHLSDNLSLDKNVNFSKLLYSKELMAIYFTILVNLNIDLIHINHLINHSFDISKVAEKLNIPIILSIHDFYYICPSIHLLNKNQEYCELICRENKWTCGCVNSSDEISLKNTINLWRNESLKFLNRCSLIIAPSNYSTEVYKDQYPEIKNNIKIIEHGRNLPKRLNCSLTPKNTPIKILFPGHISKHKGSLLIRKLKEIDKDNKLEFHFMGTTYPSLKQYGKNHGRYSREDFGKFVNNIKPSFIGIFSIIPETYSHTLTESWNSGVPVIATNLGALSERINKTGGGWLVDYKSPQKVYNQIIKIANNPKEYEKVVDNISKIKFKSKKEMTDEYKNVYDELTSHKEIDYNV